MHGQVSGRARSKGVFTRHNIVHLGSKKRRVRLGFLTANIIVFVAVASIVVTNHFRSGSSDLVSQSALAQSPDAPVNPVDKLSSADIAVNIARVTQLEEAPSVASDADTLNTELLVASNDDKLVAKPQIISASLKSKKDIISYKVAKGDTVESIAKKFGINSETIRLSNGISGNDVSEGTTLLISPVNGLVYTVKSGDTVASIASRFKANKDLLIAFNDAEKTGKFKAGEKIVIPDGVRPETNHYSYANGFNNSSAPSLSFGITPIYGGNTYAYGFCTWGVANLIPVPNNWGNAYSWDDSARLSGWHVSGVPTVGAIAQTNRNHVGIVTAVSPDGSMIKYKDMNGLAGWGRYGETADWVPSHSAFQNFITAP